MLPVPFFFLPWIQLLSENICQEVACYGRSILLHIAGDMGVSIQSEGRIGVTKNTRERLGIYTACQCVSCKGMPQVMEAGVGKPCALKNDLHVTVCCRWIDRQLWLEKIGEYPFGPCAFLSLQKNLLGAGR